MNNSWTDILKEEMEKDYFLSLEKFVDEEYERGECYPRREDVYRAFDCCAYDDVKVVILGQDPYHGEGQAHGLSFLVKDGVKFPPSLVNIFKELRNDVGCEIPISGDLTSWAKQGVLLLNATLTVRKEEAGSHQKKGWEKFTDEVIRLVSESKNNIVFILWGAFAQKKETLIDKERHLILKSAHPSPLSAYAGFWDNKHFTKTNEYLMAHGMDGIEWSEL